MRRLAFVLVLLCLAQPACTPSTECVAVTFKSTGRIGEDLVGSWEGRTGERRLVYQFRSDGTYSLVEPPWISAPDGNVQTGAYAVAGDRLTLGSAQPVRIAVSDATLSMGDSSPLMFSRVTCTGFGF